MHKRLNVEVKDVEELGLSLTAFTYNLEFDRTNWQVILMAMDSDNFHFGSGSDTVSGCQSVPSCYYNPPVIYTPETFSILAAELMHL